MKNDYVGKYHILSIFCEVKFFWVMSVMAFGVLTLNIYSA